MKDESTIQQEIQIDGPHYHSILLRNNSGQLADATGRSVRYGLGNISKKHAEKMKSSDLIGITTVVVTQEMVGTLVGIFTAIEVKREDWKPSPTDKREKAQKNFIEWVKSRGGIAGFSHDLDSFRKILRR